MAVTLVLVLVACGMLWRCRAPLRGTTLLGPWCWLLASTLVMAAGRVLVLSDQTTLAWPATIQFATATTCLCPLVSLLGARRPQDRGWHFVVLALWLILALPAVESMTLRHGQLPDIHGARSVFMAALIGLGFVNWGATRFWPAALLMAAGQFLMLAEFLPVLRNHSSMALSDLGFACWVGAIAAACFWAGRKTESDHPLNRLWLDFRDAYGLLWALRVAERINALADQQVWPIELRWRGFCQREQAAAMEPQLPFNPDRELRQALDNLLRRFVSPEWMAKRLDERGG